MCASLVRSAAAVALAVAAVSCGSDSDAGTTSSPDTAASTVGTPGDSAVSGDPRTDVVDYTIEAAAAAGFELDRSCISDLVGQLSDADAELLAAAIDDASGGDPQLSADGEALGDQVFDECIVGSKDRALIDEVIAKVLAEAGDDVDEACIRENVPKLSDEQLRLVLASETDATGPQTTDPQLRNAGLILLDCATFTTATTG